MAKPIQLGPILLATKPKSATLSAVITRADGTVEDLGVIARADFTLWGRVKTALRGMFKRA